MHPEQARDQLLEAFSEHFAALCDVREKIDWIAAGIFVDNSHLNARILQLAEDLRPVRAALDLVVADTRPALQDPYIEACFTCHEGVLKTLSNLEFLLSGPSPRWDLHRTKIVLEDGLYAADSAIHAVESVSTLKRVPRELRA